MFFAKATGVFCASKVLSMTIESHKDGLESTRQHPTLIFLVGMPRSGTKLLRDLLNRHSDIAIFPNESHFIPAFNLRYGARSDLNEDRKFRKLYREFRTTAFSRRLGQRGIVIAEADWRGRLQNGQFGEILRAMFDCYRSRSGAAIVGDKTPEYLTQVPLLYGLLPEARFIHVVRDPRDYVLSMRKAWGKSVSRAAYRWKVHVRKYVDDIVVTSAPQVTVRYEDLLTDPANTMSRLCAFLGIDYQAQMTSLDVSSEELGDARGIKSVLAGNMGKWLDQLSADELRAVESLAGRTMLAFGYQPVTTPGDGQLSSLRNLRYRATDAINFLRYRRRIEGSITAAIRESWRAYRHSGTDD